MLNFTYYFVKNGGSMGGYGSGRPHSTAKLDEGLRLDINKLKRDGMIALSSIMSGTLIWTRVRTGEETASAGYSVSTIIEDKMYMQLQYSHQSYWDDEPTKIDYKIPLETTQPHYGGKRLWFRCPSTHRRTSVLYKPCGAKYFASRYAYKNLKYQSQSRSAPNRAIDKMWKLKDRLGGIDYWRKPKGMHWKRFERLIGEIHAAEKVCDEYLAKYVMERFSPT